MHINKNDISALHLAIRELSERYRDNPIPSDRADAAIHAFLDVLYGRGNWDFEEPQYEEVSEELYRGAKTMDFNSLKSIDDLLKFAARSPEEWISHLKAKGAPQKYIDMIHGIEQSGKDSGKSKEYTMRTIIDKIPKEYIEEPTGVHGPGKSEELSEPKEASEKVAFDPKGDEGLSKGSLSKQQLIDLKQTYTEDAKSTPVGSAQYVEFMNKIKAINEQLSALNRLEEVNDEAYSFKQSAVKEAIAPEELSLPIETKEGPRPASHGYGQLQSRLKEKIEEIVSSAEDVNKVRDLAYDAIQLLEALDAQQGVTTDETIQNMLK